MRLVRTANGRDGKAHIASDSEVGVFFSAESLGGVGGRWLVVSFVPGQSTGWHAVHCDVYVAVVAGLLELALDGGDTTTVRAGDLIIEGDNTLHSWTNTGESVATVSAFEVDLP